MIIDCSHDNSGQKYTGQSFVFKSAVDQRLDGNDRIVGLMLESNLNEGNQKCKCDGDAGNLKYGVPLRMNASHGKPPKNLSIARLTNCLNH